MTSKEMLNQVRMVMIERIKEGVSLSTSTSITTRRISRMRESMIWTSLKSQPVRCLV